MAFSAELEQLVHDHPQLWLGRGLSYAEPEALPTGHPALDAVLPGGGWPVGALTVIGVPHWGSGEARLLLPAWSCLTQTRRQLIFIAPPYHPYAPALQQAGVDLRHTFLIELERSHPDVFWSMEQLLRHPETGIVLAWPTAWTAGRIRRLQLAAEAGRTLGFLFHDRQVPPTPAALRLHLNPLPEGLEIRLLKARGRLVRETICVPI
jgi:protein ImuA